MRVSEATRWLTPWPTALAVTRFQVYMFDLILLLRSTISSFWNANWVNLPRSYASKNSLLSSTTSLKSWFQDLHIYRITVVRYCKLRLGHNCSPTYPSKLGLNGWAIVMMSRASLDLLVNCPFLNTQIQLSNLCSSLNITFLTLVSCFKKIHTLLKRIFISSLLQDYTPEYLWPCPESLMLIILVKY